jgi:hypothetical protein
LTLGAASTYRSLSVTIITGAAALGITFAPAAQPVTCPFNISVVALPPHQVGGFSWGAVIRPMNDPCVSSIVVDPTNDAAWYVGGLKGLYMTKNDGNSWTQPLSGSVRALILVPAQPQLVYVGVNKRLYLSRDKGKNWNLIRTFQQPIGAILAAKGRLYVGLAWNNHVQPSGVFVSNLGGGGSTLHQFGPGHTGLIVWTQDGTLYAGTEIFDHPQPYHPPFFRSVDGGVTWTNVAGALPWHVIAAAVRPNDGFVYALTEGAGLFGSPDKGGTWQAPAEATGPSASLLMDPMLPTRLFGGRHKFAMATGGIFRSIDAGKVFQLIGLQGVTVGGVAVNGTSTRLVAVAYASGIYVSTIPQNAQFEDP